MYLYLLGHLVWLQQLIFKEVNWDSNNLFHFIQWRTFVWIRSFKTGIFFIPSNIDMGSAKPRIDLGFVVITPASLQLWSSFRFRLIQSLLRSTTVHSENAWFDGGEHHIWNRDSTFNIMNYSMVPLLSCHLKLQFGVLFTNLTRRDSNFDRSKVSWATIKLRRWICWRVGEHNR